VVDPSNTSLPAEGTAGDRIGERTGEGRPYPRYERVGPSSERDLDENEQHLRNDELYRPEDLADEYGVRESLLIVLQYDRPRLQ